MCSWWDIWHIRVGPGGCRRVSHAHTRTEQLKEKPAVHQREELSSWLWRKPLTSWRLTDRSLMEVRAKTTSCGVFLSSSFRIQIHLSKLSVRSKAKREEPHGLTGGWGSEPSWCSSGPHRSLMLDELGLILMHGGWWRSPGGRYIAQRPGRCLVITDPATGHRWCKGRPN